MEATPDPTTRLVVAVCLVVAGIAGVAVVDDAVGVVSAQSSNLTADNITAPSIEPEPANPRDSIRITAQLLNDTQKKPVEGVSVNFIKESGSGTLTAINDTSDGAGVVKARYNPSVADIDGNPAVQIEKKGGGLSTGVEVLDIVASADEIRNGAADPKTIDPSNETAISARVFNEKNNVFSGANVNFNATNGSRLRFV